MLEENFDWVPRKKHIFSMPDLKQMSKSLLNCRIMKIFLVYFLGLL